MTNKTLSSSAAQLSTNRGSDQFPLRLPNGMRSDLKIRAAQNRRTMNAELLVLIEVGIAATSAGDQGAQA